MAMTDLLEGQDAILDWIDAAAERPVHAYLVAGPRGSGAEAAARTLATRLVGADARGIDLVERHRHPDVVEFVPDGPSYKVEYVRGRINFEAMRAPVESDHKVLIVHDAERMCIIPNAANAFLKTLEEPPRRTVIVLVTSAPNEVLPTILSRCSRVDLAPLGDDRIVEMLAQVHPDASDADRARAARLSGGQLGRAKRLVDDLGPIRRAFAVVPHRLDGSGATAAKCAAELDGIVVASVAELEARHALELAEFDERMQREGYDSRGALRLRRPLLAQHVREVRRARIDLLMEGVAAIEAVVFDVMGDHPPRNDDVALPGWSPRRCAQAIDACREARAALAINEKGVLHLETLLLRLSTAG